jgi:spore germination protein KC
MRKIISIIMLAILTTSLTSCYDAHEIDSLLYIVAIGVDKGVSDKWRLTLKFSNISGSGSDSSQSSGDGESQGGYDYVSVDAPSFFTGIDMLNTALPRELVFTHAQVIVFSEELAKSGAIGEYIAPINRFTEIRRSAHVFVVKGKASDFIEEVKPFIGSMASKSFQILINESNDTGFFPHVTLEQFYTGLKSSYKQPIVTLAAVNEFEAFQKEGEPWGTEFNTGGNYTAGQLPRTGKNKIELFGTALFDGDIMVGELSGDETRYMLMARGEFDRGFFTMQDPQRPELIIPLDVKGPTEPEVKVTFDGVKPVIHLKVHLNADILAVQSRINYEEPELKVLLENVFQQIVRDGIEKVIEKCQKLDTDVFLFGDNATRNFLTINDLENYNWNSHFKDAEVAVEVEFVIRRTGTQINSYSIYHSEGSE